MADTTLQSSLTAHTAENYNKHADFVYSAKFTTPVLGLLNAQPGERIIDLGCGTGVLTEIIRAAVGASGEVWGLDSSESMVSCPPQRMKRYSGNHSLRRLEQSHQNSISRTFKAIFKLYPYHSILLSPGHLMQSFHLPHSIGAKPTQEE